MLLYDLQRARIFYLDQVGVVAEDLVEENHRVNVTIAKLAIAGLFAKLPSQALIHVEVSVKTVIHKVVFRVVLIEN